MIELITAIGSISAAIYLLILLYLIIGVLRTKIVLSDKEPFVSVIIAAHNESQYIETCLDSILNQNYPHEKIEIIIVNDRSEDATAMILNKYEKNNALIRVLTISECEPKLSPKKNALTKAINIAKGEIIATTDADCKTSPQWLKKGISYFTSETGMVVGLAPLNPTSWLISPLVCIDAIVGGITAYGTLGWNHAVTCTGRNFFYRKKLFDEIAGFSGIDHILMGDDDLLMMKMKKETDCTIRFMPDSLSAVPSATATGWHHFISQRSRHIAASKYFPRSVKIGFGITFLSKLFIMLYMIILLLGYKTSYLSISLIILTHFLTLSLISFMSFNIAQASLIIYYPFWEIYYILNQLVIGPVGFLVRSSWGKR